MAETRKTSAPRLVSLLVAFIGCVIVAVPIAFSVGGNPVLFILLGSGVTVIALGLFLFFSI
ncbi:MAG: hypothetical protein WC485_12695 [Opitutaceae bacterium]